MQGKTLSGATSMDVKPCVKGRTIRKVMGVGGGEFSACTIFFFRSLLMQEFFFQVNPSARIFFQTNIAFFNSEILIHYLFLCFINYSTLTTDQRIQATLVENLFENGERC